MLLFKSEFLRHKAPTRRASTVMGMVCTIRIFCVVSLSQFIGNSVESGVSLLYRPQNIDLGFLTFVFEGNNSMKT